MFMTFMAVILLVSFSFLIKRLPELQARGRLESWRSREAAFMVNNWILLLCAFIVLFLTLFPKISKLATGTEISVGPPVFNQWMVPAGLMLLFLTGVGPLIAWRKASDSHLRYQFTWPALAALGALAASLFAGLHKTAIAPVIGFSLCAFTMTTVIQEFSRGAAIRRRNTGSDYLTAVLGMIIRGRRRYGGYIVHLGIVLMFVGFAGQAYQKEKDKHFLPGETLAFGRYKLRFDRLTHTEDRQKEMVTGEFTVFQGDKEIARMRPARWFFHDKPQPTTEVAIRRSPAEDLYITLANYDFAQGSGLTKLVINPMVDWVWLGFLMLAFGTGIALLPETMLAGVAARAGLAPAGGAAAATRGAMVLLLGLGLLGARPAYARDQAVVAADRAWLRTQIMCPCGGCRSPLSDCQMAPNCTHGESPTTAMIDRLLAEGKTREEVLDAITDKFGMQIRLVPPDKGFNRLIWALPYGLGVAGAGGLAYAAWRFSKRTPTPDPAEAPAAGPVDPDLEDRLDDELSRIDT
jgi:cytochrome c-type biogenesis protein CcmF